MISADILKSIYFGMNPQFQNILFLNYNLQSIAQNRFNFRW